MPVLSFFIYCIKVTHLSASYIVGSRGASQLGGIFQGTLQGIRLISFSFTKLPTWYNKSWNVDIEQRKIMQKMVKSGKNMFTSFWMHKHPKAGQNTQHKPTIKKNQNTPAFTLSCLFIHFAFHINLGACPMFNCNLRYLRNFFHFYLF